MDPVIIAAFIGAIAALIAAIIGLIGSKQAKDELNKVEKETLDTSEALRKKQTDTFGYKIAYFKSKMEMTDLQGTTELTRTCRGVKITKSGVTITHFPGKIWVDHPTGQIISPPQFIGTPSLPAKAVDLKIIQTSDKACQFDIEVTGGLTESDPGLDYEFQAICSKGVCVTREEMHEAYKKATFEKEYHSYDAVDPIDILDLEVVFPEGYIVQPFPIVFYLYSERLNNTEFERVKAGFDKSSTSPKFRIEQPNIGFRYAIYWLPPPTRVLAKLGQ